MVDWLTQYTAALEARDAREQAHKPYIDAYTRLAERTSVQQSAAATTTTTIPEQPATGKSIKATTTPATEDLAALRTDLATTQKARASLATTLKDVEAQLSQLQAERQQNMTQVTALTKAKAETERKLRDRDEELRGKTTLAEQAQDEMVALGLQLHISEEKAEKLARENKELVERWMQRMGAEADKVNRESKWS